jgi:transketolase C-terminal domain/subunit
MQRIGLQDTFAESGPYLDLLEKYEMSARHIAAAVVEVVERKKS